MGKIVSKKEVFIPRIVAFACNWCSYAGADNAGVNRMQYSPHCSERERRHNDVQHLKPWPFEHRWLCGVPLRMHSS